MVDPWHLMEGVALGGQLSPSYYERRFDSLCHNGLMATISFSSSRSGDLFRLWDDFSRARVFPRFALMMMNSFIRL